MFRTPIRLGREELITWTFWRALLGEFVASLLFIFFVCGCTIHLPGNPPHSLLHISATTGCTVAIFVSIFWDISGSHFNPAVTLTLFLQGKVSLIRALLYVIVQCAGCIAGAAILYAYTPADYRGTLGALNIHPLLTPGKGVAVEITLTYAFLCTVINCTRPENNYTGFQAPVAIGMSVAIGLMMGIPYTGACMNPLRALGPAVVMNQFDNHWIYWVGPFTCSILAVVSFDYILSPLPQHGEGSEEARRIEMKENLQKENSMRVMVVENGGAQE